MQTNVCVVLLFDAFWLITVRAVIMVTTFVPTVSIVIAIKNATETVKVHVRKSADIVWLVILVDMVGRINVRLCQPR